MKIFQKLTNFFTSSKESEGRNGGDLVKELETTFGRAIRAFSSDLEPARNQVAKAELAAFAYYCIWDWHRKQSEFDRDYDVALSLLRYEAAESASLMNFSVSDAEQIGVSRDAEDFIEDRLRIYDLIATHPTDSNIEHGARLYRTLAKLTSISCGRCRLEVQPAITDIDELEIRARIAKVERKEEVEAHMAVWGFETRNRAIPQVIDVLCNLYQLRVKHQKSEEASGV